MTRSSRSNVLALALSAVLLAAPLAGCARTAGTGTSYSGVAPASPTLERQVAPTDSGGTASNYAPAGAPQASKGSAADSVASAVAASADRMVIRSGNVRIEVKKVPDTVTALRALVKRYGGVLSNLQLSSDTGGGSPEPMPATRQGAAPTGLPYSASVTVQVPVSKMDAFRADVAKLGKILAESADAQDVTQQHADLAARLANSKAEEARLRTFFNEAKSVNDMLAIERELSRVRGDIESMTAQLNTLERQAAMATLTIELVEPQAIVRPSNGIDWGFGDALTTAIQGLAGVLQGIIVIAVAGLPIWLGIVGIVLLVRWRLRVRARRHASAEEAPSEAEA